MDPTKLLTNLNFLWSPIVVTIMAGLATFFIWMAVAPAQKKSSRLTDYGSTAEAIENPEMEKSFILRAVWPVLKRFLRLLGSLAPSKSIESTREMITSAGGLGGMSPLDFIGLRLLFLALAAIGAFLLYSP
ncbi:MAG: hypothetical protein ACYC6L_12945, partial [Anaerolineae bacterium]